MTTEYVVYNLNTGNVATPHPVPREMAESICAANNNPAFAPRYAMRAVDFDYDALLETARRHDAQDFEAWPMAIEYERQWSVDLHALANGPMLPALMVTIFAAQVIVAVVLG